MTSQTVKTIYCDYCFQSAAGWVPRRIADLRDQRIHLKAEGWEYHKNPNNGRFMDLCYYCARAKDDEINTLEQN